MGKGSSGDEPFSSFMLYVSILDFLILSLD